MECEAGDPLVKHSRLALVHDHARAMLVRSVNHAASTTRYKTRFSLDGILIQSMGVTIEVEVESSVHHWSEEVSNINLESLVMADDDKPIFLWHLCEGTLEPFEL